MISAFTAGVMWCIALVLLYFFSKMDALSVIPVGFAGCGNYNFTFYVSEASRVMDKK